MKSFTKAILVATLVLTGAAVVYAQGFLRADHKINGGRARSNQRHAQDESLELYHLTQAERPVPKSELVDFISTIRNDLTASDKALAKLEAESRKVKDASELYDSIRKHHAKAIEHCATAEKAAADKAAVGNSATEIYYELEAAQADAQKLLAALKIDGLEPPKKK